MGLGIQLRGKMLAEGPRFNPEYHKKTKEKEETYVNEKKEREEEKGGLERPWVWQ